MARVRWPVHQRPRATGGHQEGDADPGDHGADVPRLEFVHRRGYGGSDW